MTESTRRQLLKNGALIGGTICGYAMVHRGSAQSAPEDGPADPSTIESWMNGWMATSKEAVGTLHLSKFADPVYFLTKPITWKPNPGQEAFPTVTVPIGFVTDFASIPRMFWSMLPPDGLYTYPAIVHDFLYWHQSTSRQVADQIMRFAMEDFRVSTVVSGAIYRSVDLFGGSAWSENKKLRESGEKRTLKTFPDNPTTRWKDWKKIPDVFQ
jgi:hypothetical protein